MSEQVQSGVETSDDVLLEQTRAGDQRAFAELWRRHYRSGARVARQFTSVVDADDLVAESFTRIYQRVMAGGTRISAFRPYLYTTIRNLASTWGASSREIAVDDLSEFEDPRIDGDPAMLALDRTLTARAFRALPERWQTVLWYTEVEGMDPHEVAPIMGLAANSVAALSYRAREGLRKAWLQAHINDSTASGECRWVIARMGDHARKALTKREAGRVNLHLLDCTRCAIINAEVDEVGSRLALVLIPLLLGSAAGGSLLASLGDAGAAMAGQLLPAVSDGFSSVSDSISAAPETISAVATASAVATPLAIGAASTTIMAPALLAGSLAVVIAVSGSFVVVSAQAGSEGDQQSPDGSTQSAPADPNAPAAEPAGTAPGAGPGIGNVLTGATPGPSDPSNVPGSPAAGGSPGVVGSVVDGLGGVIGGVVGGVVDPLLETVTGGAPPEGHSAPGGVVGADISFTLSGTGTPGAKVSLQAAGQVYATTTVDSNGRFTLAATAIPGGLSSLELVQAVDKGFLRGLLGPVLGLLDSLVNGLIKPLNLVTQPVGVTIVVMG